MRHSVSGNSCIHYFGFSWAGLYDGRYDDNTLKNLVLKDDKYYKVRDNVQKCETLVIDEISMLSKKDFEQLEMVCRVVKNNGKIFGGLQVVVSGDFYQLPPVGNHVYKDSGEFCFQSVVWQEFFKHRINLDTVVRQSEPQFIKAIWESSAGHISKDSDLFLKSCERNLPENVNPVHLFARNIDASLYNNDRLDELQTHERLYTATKNSGSQKSLNKILAPYYLRLKMDCPVMLLRNLGGKLVNGLCGKVIDLQPDSVSVHFPSINETHDIHRYTFSVYDTKRKSTAAEREQFPLRLAYAITIHKSQGMTLDYVCLHCDGIFESGQLSVAISRAVSSEGLQLLNYRKGLCPQPKGVVTSFYRLPSDPFCVESSDCCGEIVLEQFKEHDNKKTYDTDDSDFDDDELDLLEKIDVSSIPLLPSYFAPETILHALIIENPVSDSQKHINHICERIATEFLDMFLAKTYEVIQGIMERNVTAVDHTNTQIWTSAMNEYHMYVVSSEFKSTVPLLYEYQTCLSDEHMHVAAQLAFELIKAEIHYRAQHVELQESTPSANIGKMSDAGKSKIRYVGGMCIAKARQHLINAIHTNLGNPTAEARFILNKCRLQLHFVYDTLQASMEDIDIINDPTLQEIERQQNVTKGLTYISDPCFEFFMLLNEKITEILTFDMLKRKEENLFECCRKIIAEDAGVKTAWSKLCACKIEEDQSLYLFNNVLHRLLVCHKQFLKDMKSKLN
ncbi:MAG: hypothetical protein AB2693_14215, partial [Candidatus Thiodiazotropha sp.]